MKKLNMITLLAILATPSYGAPRKAVFKEKAAKEAKARRTMHKTEPQKSQWYLTADQTYYWEDEWLEDGFNAYTYDDKGNIATHKSTDVEGYGTLTTYVYDGLDRIVRRTIQNIGPDQEAVNSQLTEVKYDEKVSSFITEHLDYNWDGEKWAQNGNNYRHAITRDAAGNITLIERYVLFQGEFDVTNRLAIEYGTDGKASKITESALDYDYASGDYVWAEGTSMTDIEWDRTNGQITNIETLFLGDNRVKSAILHSEGEDQPLEVTYVPDSESFTAVSRAKAEADDGTIADVTDIQSMTILDQYGSYDLTDTERYEYDDPDTPGERVVEEYTMVEKLHLTEHELVLLNYLADESEGYEPEVFVWARGTTTTDPEKGYLTEYILQEYDFDTEDFVNVERVVFSHYSDLSGVSLIEAAGNDTPAVYYNLQGVRVENPSAGLYIERRGNTARKILVK